MSSLKMDCPQAMEDQSANREELLRRIKELQRQVSQLEDAQEAKDLAERALAENEAHLRSLMDTATNFVVYRLAVDHQSPHHFKVVFVSPSIRELLGVRDASNLETWFAQIHPDDRPRIMEANERAFGSNRFSQMARVWHEGKKEWRWIQAIATGALTADGDIAFVNGIMIDVTDHVRAERELAKHRERLEQLVAQRTARLEAANRQLQQEIAERELTEQAFRESEERFRRAFEHAGVGMALINPEGTFLQVNHSLSRMLGHRPQEMVGKHLADFTHPEDLEEFLKHFQALSTGAKELLALEKRCTHKEGHFIWVTVSASLVRDAQNRPVYSVAHIQDITDRKRAEEALMQLAAGVAHNFNNVLMAILGNAQAAQQELGGQPLDLEQAARLLDNVVQGARGGRDVVHRLSRFVGRRQGMRGVTEVLDIGELLHSLRKSLPGIWPLFASGKLELDLAVASGLYVNGVRGELMEVLLNIVKNAVEAMPEGGRLRISGQAADNQVAIEFLDSGPGVSQDFLARMFDPFFTTKGVAGQGLGLAVSKGIVQSHGGSIRAFNETGHGLLISLRLPLADNLPVRPSSEIKSEGRKGLQLLLVEDEGLVAMGIQALLNEAGHHVGRADCLAQALTKLELGPPDLVLCDLGLPDGSGWEVLASLRARMKSLGQEPAPILVVSGWNDDQLNPLPQGMAPPAGYLAKPVDRKELLDKVTALAKQKAPLDEGPLS
ncbi:hypothetical protein AAU61_17700 [Desulfocarbo indianensis]|nr:hypothetical protein AAU61_17700 [Desulfocarbo indianensis]